MNTFQVTLIQPSPPKIKSGSLMVGYVARSVINCFSNVVYQTQNDYMRAYLPKRNTFLGCILAGEAISSMSCESCGQPARWRCLSCLGRPILCRGCCRRSHRQLIFHRVQKWTGKFFQDAGLWEVGVRLSVGHGGGPCPEQQIMMDSCASIEEQKDEEDRVSILQRSFQPEAPVGSGPRDTADMDTDDTDASEEPEDDPEDPLWEDTPPGPERVPLRTPTPMKDDLENDHLLMVDSSGLASMPVIWCRCPDTEHRQDELLIDLQMLPASYEKIRTVFTFQCLDDYRLSNLECKTTAYQYFQRLRRLTNPAFPRSVPNRYNEFLRCTRQWRDLKLRKWFGFGHRHLAPSRGSLALFCAACPQPGVNLPTDYASRFTM